MGLSISAIPKVVQRFYDHALGTVVFRSQPGIGKCLAPDTPVLLYDGTTTTACDVRTGDLLMGPDSRPRRVLSTTTGEDNMYQITPVKGEPWVCNSVHVLTLVNSCTDEVIDIPLDSYLSKSMKDWKLFSVGVDFPTAQTPLPIDPYFIGVWLGDGSKGLKGVVVTKEDPEIKAAMETVATQWGLQCRTHTHRDRCTDHRIISPTTKGRKRSHNALLSTMQDLFGFEVHIPQVYMTASRTERLELLAGLLDTDGHLINNCFEITQKNKLIFDGIVFLARSLGLRASTSVKAVNSVNYYRCHISGHTDMIPTRIPRKQATARRQNKDVLRAGFTVTPVGRGGYSGFTLDGDGRFLLGDFTVTHNTDQVREAVRLLSEQYGEPFGFIEEHLASRSEVDLRGYLIPTSDGQATYTKPDFWHIVEKHTRGVLFLDELFQCSVEMQKAIAPLLLDKRVGNNTLPDGWIVIGATNGVEHRSGVTPALSHVTNRICLMEVSPPSPEELCAYYMKHNMPAECIALVLKSPSTVLGLSSASQGTPYCTPRSFKRVGELMNTFASPMESLTSSIGKASIEGLIGLPAYTELSAICQLTDSLPSLEEIVRSPDTTPVPTTLDKQWLIASMLGVRANEEQINNVFTYASRMPPNVAFICLFGCWQRGVIGSSSVITTWVANNTKLLQALL